jgi:radial spoke head protein 4A
MGSTMTQKFDMVFSGWQAEVSGYPQFPGIEINYLRAQIARISHATQIAPSGYYSVS